MGRTTVGRRGRATAILVVMTLIGALFVIAAPAGAANEKHVTLHALAVIEGSGGKASTGTTNAFTVSYGKAGGSDFRVGFSEDEVAGTGDQWTRRRLERRHGRDAAQRRAALGVEVDYDVNGKHRRPERRCAHDRRPALADAGRQDQATTSR